MAIIWKTVVDGYSKIGVDWDAVDSDDGMKLTYQPKVYLHYTNLSGETYLEYRWSLKLGTSVITENQTLLATTEYNSTNTAPNGGKNFSGQVLIDTYAKRTVTKTTSSQNLTLKLDFGDLFGGYGSGKTYGGLDSKNYWTGTWTLTVDALPQYQIVFDPNGGTGGPGTLTKTHGTDLTIPSTIPTRTNYKFMGWDTERDGSGWRKQPGETITGDESKTMYAIWERSIEMPFTPDIQIDLTQRDMQRVLFDISIEANEVNKVDSLYYKVFRNNELANVVPLNPDPLTYGFSLTDLTLELDDNCFYVIEVYAENEIGQTFNNVSFYSRPAAPELLAVAKCIDIEGNKQLKVYLSVGHILEKNRDTLVVKYSGVSDANLASFTQKILQNEEVFTVPAPEDFVFLITVNNAEGISSEQLSFSSEDTDVINIHNIYFKSTTSNCNVFVKSDKQEQVKFNIPE